MVDSPLIEIGLPISLFIIMIGIGLSLSLTDFAKELKQPRGLMLGSICQIVLLPLLGFALVGLMDLPPAIAVGLIIVAACPGGATSNVVAYLAKSNVALSIIMTVIASLLTILSLPLFVSLAIEWQLGKATSVEMPVLPTVMLLSGILLLPVCIGMGIRSRYCAMAQKLEGPLNLFGALVLLLMIVLISWEVRDRIGELIIQGGIVSVALGAGALILALLTGRLFNLQTRDSLTIGVELSIKNTTIGLMVATSFLGSAEMAIPAMVYGLVMYAFGGILVFSGRRLTANEGPVPVNSVTPTA